jgi:hypothetical protein
MVKHTQLKFIIFGLQLQNKIQTIKHSDSDTTTMIFFLTKMIL